MKTLTQFKKEYLKKTGEDLSKPATESEGLIVIPRHLATDCICQGGTKEGHLNQAGGYCCPHWGNTCGFDHN